MLAPLAAAVGDPSSVFADGGISIEVPCFGRPNSPAAPYGEFDDLIRTMYQSGREAITVMTFNYEIAIDYAFHFNSIPINYCLDPSRPENLISLLKLHGSFNWTRCANPECNKVSVLELAGWLSRKQSAGRGKETTIRMSAELPECRPCGKYPERNPRRVWKTFPPMHFAFAARMLRLGRFTRRKARLKFGYKRNQIMRSET